ncbi:MAG TPA: class I SAM-dependent methyltransferase [Polyangiaceae bacterium]|nr:class I SAM-dependent methyltransferase [Polyangiaceae bacterium]
MSAGDWMPPWLYYQHLTRYAWAAEHCRGARVADAACGVGYGSRILMRAGARSVDGYDVSLEAIEQARDRMARRGPFGPARVGSEEAGLRFAVADATCLPVPDGEYDVLVSFETIEHIEDDERYLAEASRVVKAGGLFLCSTPNREIIDAGKSIDQRPFNPFHVREYDEAELHARLARHFPSVTLYGQTRFGSRYVRALGYLGRRFPWTAVRVHQARKLLTVPWENQERHVPQRLPMAGEPEVLMALCRKE